MYFQHVGNAQGDGDGQRGQLGERGFFEEKKGKREVLIRPCDPLAPVTPASSRLLPRGEDIARRDRIAFG